MSLYSKYVSVQLDLAIDKAFDYEVPAGLEIKTGMRVKVPVKGKLQTGYVVEVKETPSYPNVKAIEGVSDQTELLTKELFELARWMSKYYCTPLGKVLKVMIPSSIRSHVKQKQQLFVMRAKTREELLELCHSLRAPQPAQAAILEVMLKAKKGLFLSELLEKAGCSRSPVDTLAKRGVLAIDIVRADRSPLQNEEYFQTMPKALNISQQSALDKVLYTMDRHEYATHLLFGITGSGKTEVYMQAIDQALKQNKGVIMMVPEISLTPQTIERFKSRFEDRIAILHHRLSHGERSEEWHRLHRGEAKTVIGARSAIFSPLLNLGLIIVDEEHENSYKQSEEMPCYNARDIAVMRGKFSSVPVILGSATPSIESYFNAQKGKYHLSKLEVRADKAALPFVKIVNMKHECEKAKRWTQFSGPLLDGIQERTQRGEKTILFLNRRGYHTSLFCPSCQEAVKCAHCDVALTFHMNENHLACHLCGFTVSPPKSCPKCKQTAPMKYKGVGTEQIEKALHAILPEVRTLRIDADTTRHKGSHQALFRAFGTGKADVLIGTQMVAKGLHFPDVTLVGILNCDNSLNIPDFRASENSFQLMTQVAGRAGRGGLPGDVIIQTWMPDNPTILHASQQDYEGFYHAEIQTRELFHFPPFTQIAKVLCAGTEATFVKEQLEGLRECVVKLLPSTFMVHPVIPCGHAKVKDLYRFQFILRAPSLGPFIQCHQAALQSMKWPSRLKLKIDINTLSTF